MSALGGGRQVRPAAMARVRRTDAVRKEAACGAWRTTYASAGGHGGRGMNLGLTRMSEYLCCRFVRPSAGSSSCWCKAVSARSPMIPITLHPTPGASSRQRWLVSITTSQRISLADSGGPDWESGRRRTGRRALEAHAEPPGLGGPDYATRPAPGRPRRVRPAAGAGTMPPSYVRRSRNDWRSGRPADGAAALEAHARADPGDLPRPARSGPPSQSSPGADARQRRLCLGDSGGRTGEGGLAVTGRRRWRRTPGWPRPTTRTRPAPEPPSPNSPGG